MKTLVWKRSNPNSINNFDLAVTNARHVNATQLRRLLDEILKHKHRKKTLRVTACVELRRWFDEPETPLKSAAYVLLSNWFMTNSGDRHSKVATGCEALWDALFPCRPPARLSSSQAGKNHAVLPAEFDRFWRRVLEAQGDARGNRQYDVVIERDEEGFYVGSVPQIPGCHTQAESLDELMQRIQEAIALCLDVQGEPESKLKFVGVQRITVAA